jgi:putative tricarboxylic transport membrane protein
MKRTSDRIFGMIGLAIAALMVWRTGLIQESFIQDPLGPKAFPYMIAAVIGLTSLVIMLRPDAEPHWPAFGKLAEIGFAVLVMIGYAQFLPTAGFVVATAIAAAFLSWRLGTPPHKALLAGILISVGIYVVFHLVLGLSLARGPWGF